MGHGMLSGTNLAIVRIVDTGQRMAKPDRNFSRMRRLVILGVAEIRDYFRLNLGKWAISKNAG